MIEDQWQTPPHSAIVATVVVLLLVVLVFLSEQGEALSELAADLFSHVAFVCLPLFLILTIQFLSSNSGSSVSGVFSTGGPSSIHRASGSPIGVALLLILVLILLYNRVSIFRGGDDDDSDD